MNRHLWYFYFASSSVVFILAPFRLWLETSEHRCCMKHGCTRDCYITAIWWLFYQLDIFNFSNESTFTVPPISESSLQAKFMLLTRRPLQLWPAKMPDKNMLLKQWTRFQGKGKENILTLGAEQSFQVLQDFSILNPGGEKQKQLSFTVIAVTALSRCRFHKVYCTWACGASLPGGLASHASPLPWNTQMQKQMRRRNKLPLIKQHQPTDMVSSITYFSRHEEGSEESPLHIVIWGKPAVLKWIEQAEQPQLENYFFCFPGQASFIVYLFAIRSVSVPPSHRQVERRQLE